MLTAFDVAVGVLVLISAILATVRGLTREILSLATWAGSAAVAAYLYFNHADLLQPYFADEIIAKIVLVGASFLVSLIVLHLITMKIADWVVDSKIGPLDRTLGFVFGLARGILIAIIFVIFGANLLNLADQPWARDSKSWPYLQDWGNSLMTVLPDDLERQVSDLLHRGGTDEASPTDEAPADETTDVPEDSTPLEPAPVTVPTKPSV